MPREQNAQIPMAVVGIVMKFFQIVIDGSLYSFSRCILYPRDRITDKKVL